jgi:MinD superfamily P-loop ATPase
MAHAQLFPGAENSGRLVALLRKKAREVAKTHAAKLILSDGPPGIGCPVISSLSGTDLVVIVTEPTPSGRHDLERVVQLCQHFNLPCGVIINKFDINSSQTRGIESFCHERALRVFGKLPHDVAMTKAMVNGKVISEYQNTALTEGIRCVWDQILIAVAASAD